MNRRVYLDDLRQAPRGWIQTQTAEETIALLKQGDVEELSLDYNLGPSTTQTGDAVLRWIEREIHKNPQWQLPKVIRIHSGHYRGRQLMIDHLDDIREQLKAEGREVPRTWW